MVKKSFDNPLRVYSSLLEFDDKSALRMYNKLLDLSMKKKKDDKKQGKEADKNSGKTDLASYFQDD